ncbi:GNAT family N-acetyltransferase [Paenibacillus piri]|uniref:N-acetyltransferase n=1 Tax=Paenibacillus piri TaxID=2547395 RepID=A0A4R5KVK8_9BACL|nr:GNAT family protein [Paenibacillus piri]TDF99188.1 N-acetyltransferase [Paenibacillus piri]
MAYHYWQGKYVVLRAMKASDQSLFESFDDEIARNVDAIYWPQSERRRSDWLEGELKPRQDDTFRWIAENRQGEVVGTIDTFACSRRNGTFKYGIALAPEHRNKGYATEMIAMVIRYYFYEMNYQKVTPHVYSFNQASIKLHEKMGFRKEGQLRNMVYTDGEYFDEIHYGMTRADFDALYGRSEWIGSP